MKFVFIWIAFKMQPIRLQFLWIFLLALLAYWLPAQMPSTGLPLLNIMLRSALCALIFGGPLLFFKWVPDINEFVVEVWKKFGRKS
jgi:hypothetical protein